MVSAYTGKGEKYESSVALYNQIFMEVVHTQSAFYY